MRRLIIVLQLITMFYSIYAANFTAINDTANFSLFTIVTPNSKFTVSNKGIANTKLYDALTINIKPVVTSRFVAYKVQLLYSGSDSFVITDIYPFGKQSNIGASYKINNKIWLQAKGLPAQPLIVPHNMVVAFNSISANEKNCYSGLFSWQNRRTDTIKISNNLGFNFDILIDTISNTWQNGFYSVFKNLVAGNIDIINKKNRIEVLKPAFISVILPSRSHFFYNSIENKYKVNDFIENGIKTFGGYDNIAIDGTWGLTGLDDRTIFDYYNLLPQGIEKLTDINKLIVAASSQMYIGFNINTFIKQPYNTAQSINTLLKLTNINGIIINGKDICNIKLLKLDSIENSNFFINNIYELPNNIDFNNYTYANRGKPSLNFLSWVYPLRNAFVVSTPEWYNIKHQAQLAFWNGNGIFIDFSSVDNFYTWPNNDPLIQQLSETYKSNFGVFKKGRQYPLVEYNKQRQIVVNQWTSKYKDILTLYRNNVIEADTFTVHLNQGIFPGHYVNIIDHTNVNDYYENNTIYLSVKFNSNNIACIVRFTDIIKLTPKTDSLIVTTSISGTLKVFIGKPNNKPIFEGIGNYNLLNLHKLVPNYAGILTFQLYNDTEILDEVYYTLEPKQQQIITKPVSTLKLGGNAFGMVEITGGMFYFQTECLDTFTFGLQSGDLVMNSFYIDEYPVTNAQYYDFIASSDYKPKDSRNYLKHWESGTYPAGQGNYPVVYVSINDAKAYSAWAGKRLPTEIEWQYAAQGSDNRTWPWGNDFQATKCNNAFGRPTPVNTFRKGKSAFGVADMVGNVWQLTNDIYYDGYYSYAVIKGGSYYKPTDIDDNLYTGPQPLYKRKFMPLVSESQQRAATIGFRCVKDK